MLKKLYVYDLEANRRLMLPFLFSSLGLGGIALLLTYIMQALPEKLSAVTAALGLLYGLLLLAIVLLYAVSFFLVIFRFYKNLFTDEGYLTLVLPVDMKTQVLAKAISGSTWLLLATLSLILGLAVAVLPPLLRMNGETGILTQIVEFLSASLFGDAPPALRSTLIALLILTLLSGILANLMLIYTAITLGSLIVRTHKIVGSVLFYFAVSAVVNGVSQILGGIVVGLAAVGLPYAAQLIISFAMSTVLNLGLSVACFFIISLMLEKKLNLE